MFKITILGGFIYGNSGLMCLFFIDEVLCTFLFYFGGFVREMVRTIHSKSYKYMQYTLTNNNILEQIFV